jgi:uncharacterized glyoxalase superfamily protein PhnB
MSFIYPTLIPYLTVNDGPKAIAFYQAAFGATERFHLSTGDGKIGHCELIIGDQMFMLGDEMNGMNTSPTTLGGVAAKFVLMVPNADEAHQRAIQAGATQVMPPCDMFYGFRCSLVRDPFGHEWMLQHEVEKLSPDDMQKRWAAMMSQCSPADKAKA